jgi:hypothetical protein
MFVGHLTGPPDSNTQSVFIMTHFIFSVSFLSGFSMVSRFSGKS